MSSDEEPLSPILEALFEKFKAPSMNDNLTNECNILQSVPSQTPLPFLFTACHHISIRNKS